MNLVFSSYVFELFIYQIDKLMVIRSRELSLNWQRYLGIVLVKRKNRIMNSTLIDKHMICLVLDFLFLHGLLFRITSPLGVICPALLLRLLYRTDRLVLCACVTRMVEKHES